MICGHTESQHVYSNKVYFNGNITIIERFLVISTGKYEYTVDDL